MKALTQRKQNPVPEMFSIILTIEVHVEGMRLWVRILGPIL